MYFPFFGADSFVVVGARRSLLVVPAKRITTAVVVLASCLLASEAEQAAHQSANDTEADEQYRYDEYEQESYEV